MKFPNIGLKIALKVISNYTLKRLNKSNEFDKKSLSEEYGEWINVREGLKDMPHVLYANQINIEQL